MFPPPNPTNQSSSSNSSSTSRSNNPTRPTFPLQRAPLSNTSSSTNTSCGGTSDESSGSIPTLSSHGITLGPTVGFSTRGDNRPEDFNQYEDHDDMPLAGPSKPRRRVQKDRSIGGFGHAVDIKSGCLEGKRIRFSLVIAQEPIHGRRKTEKDRRPVAHAPILRFKIRQVHPGGREDDIDVSTIEPGCFLCAAELFEVSSSSMPFISNSTETTTISNHSESNVTPTMRTQSAFTTTPSQPYTTNPADADIDSAPSHLPPPPPHRAASWAADGPSGMAGMTPAARLRAEAERPLPPPSRPSVSSSSGDSTPSSATTTPHMGSNSNITPSTSRPELTSDQGSDPTPVKVPDLEPKADGSFRPGIQRTAGERSSGSSGDGDPATAKPSSKRPKQESARHSDESQRTTQSTGLMAQRNLFGSLHVPAVRVIAPEGDLGLWFLFTDLSVRQEGTFALKFRVFDVTAADKESQSSAPILVEARSQAFKVYSPRNFPGLPKPTELAEHFGRQGFKLNTRKNERQAKTPPLEEPPLPPPPVQQNPPQRPEAHPLQSSPETSSGEVQAAVRAGLSSSSSDRTSQRPGTAGTINTTTTGTASTSWSAESNSAGETNSNMGGSKGKVPPSPLSRSFERQ